MRELILAVKSALQVGMADDVRPVDIYLTPHINYIPRSVKMPCIAVADAGSTRQELVGGAIRTVYRLQIVVYCDLKKEEAVLVGDEASGKAGLLDLTESVHEVLHGNTLGISSVGWASCRQESAIELFGDETAMVCRKILHYEYEMEA